MAQLPWPISVGIWFVESRGGDRFTRQYKPGTEIPARIQLIGKMRGCAASSCTIPTR